MAAPVQGEAAWNRWHVPWPASYATVALPAQHPAVRCLPAVVKGCYKVSTLLKSKAVDAEGKVLHSILYGFHNRMSHHKTYLSLKQVEQCLKRLNQMNLMGSIQDLAELCPKKSKSENAGECLVPSQPVIEVVAVKILGGCKLLLRLLECCCKAFVLSVQHLCLEEYILLNTVVSGLLSRLWILYRCVLQSLISLYGVLSGLLQEVSRTQQMPYIKGFTFPSEITEFLGPLYLEIKKRPKELATKKATGWLNKLFAGPAVASRCSKERGLAAPTRCSKMTNIQRPIDIGKPVLVKRANRGKQLGFDIKTLCRQLKPRVQEEVDFRLTLSEAKAVRSQHAKSLVLRFREACSFGELSEALKTAILYCKSKKLKSEAFFLGTKLLKSKRLHHVEAQGCSLQKKLGCVKASICKYLLSGLQKAHWPKQYHRASSWQQRKIKLSRRSKSVSKKTPEFVQQNTSSLFEDSMPGAASLYPSWQCEHSLHLRKAGDCSANKHVGEQDKVGTSEPVALERNPGPTVKGTSENDDIDDIFAAMGV
ncbi:nucleolus and neural progenitor protein isoform X2 [Chrysemys picta bellii]|uniref:Nucleolus and neural progenitor protein n=2 Tax=Chrysemys picta bellii TaxID=8478 RepID=A0A8C3FBR7_CHRPI|nr:nucleolus and neural progenitor protein isoform X2 [Chrysemys picta bellii]